MPEHVDELSSWNKTQATLPQQLLTIPPLNSY